MKMNRLARLLAGLLCFLLLTGDAFSPVAAYATETEAMTDENTAQSEEIGDVLEDPTALQGEPDAADADTRTVQYVATATVALKVRRRPDMDSTGGDSIPKGSMVYVLELGDEWSLVDTGKKIGYVQTQYLSDLRAYGQTQDVDEAAAVQAAAAEANAANAAPDTRENFEEKFTAYAYKPFLMRREMDERSGGAVSVASREQVTVGAVYGEWCYVRYNNSYGYARVSALFKWARIDPYAGDIPGVTKLIGLAFLNKPTDIRSYDDNGAEVLKTVNAGTAVAVQTKDAQGLYPLPYYRTTGFVQQSDVSYLMEVVAWDEAESGDLIACMSTYYAVQVHTLQYQGRNYNIYLGTSLISGLVVQPEEKVDIYDVMARYRKSTGYHPAPIWSKDALWGYGGGCCQVNTTLYNALIRAPIFINWRKVHADVGIYYCPVGLDAAVGGGDITMIFTNTLPYAIRINFFMSDGRMTAGIFRV